MCRRVFAIRFVIGIQYPVCAETKASCYLRLGRCERRVTRRRAGDSSYNVMLTHCPSHNML